MHYNDVIKCADIHQSSINISETYRKYGLPYYERSTGALGLFHYDEFNNYIRTSRG